MGWIFVGKIIYKGERKIRYENVSPFFLADYRVWPKHLINDATSLGPLSKNRANMHSDPNSPNMSETLI